MNKILFVAPNLQFLTLHLVALRSLPTHLYLSPTSLAAMSFSPEKKIIKLRINIKSRIITIRSIDRSFQNLKVYTNVILPFWASCSARAIMNPRPKNTSSALDKSPSIDVKEYKYYLQYFTTTNITAIIITGLL